MQFDPAKNPLRETPDGKIIAEEISATDEFEIKGSEFKGDWVEIERKWLKKPLSGWIRWRDEEGNTLVLLHPKIEKLRQTKKENEY